MPFVNYQRRPLVFNEMGKPINDLSMEDAIKEANLDYKPGFVNYFANRSNHQQRGLAL